MTKDKKLRNSATQQLSNKDGITILETLIAIGIMSIMMVGFLSMISNQQKETKSVSEILAGLDLQKNLISVLAEGSVCNHILNNPTQLTFNSNNLPQTITPSLPIYASVTSGIPGVIIAQVGQRASVYSPSMVIKSIVLNITNGSGTTYTGNWIIDFDETKSVRPHKPVTVSTILKVDSSAPGNTKITGCMGSGGGSKNWVDVLASRTAMTSYQNNLPYEIQVTASTFSGNPGARCSIRIIVNGISIGNNFVNNSIGNASCSSRRKSYYILGRISLNRKKVC